MPVDSFRESATLCRQDGRLPLLVDLGLEKKWLCRDVLLNAVPNSLHVQDCLNATQGQPVAGVCIDGKA